MQLAQSMRASLHYLIMKRSARQVQLVRLARFLNTHLKELQVRVVYRELTTCKHYLSRLVFLLIIRMRCITTTPNATIMHTLVDLGEARVVALKSVALQIELPQRGLEFGKRDRRRAAHAVVA